MPKVVDETAAGEPVVDVRGVRLVLREHATFFNRLVPCANCGRETAGSAVRTPADLDLPPNSATCRDCRRAAAAVAPPPERSPAPAPVEDPSGPRLGALEARVDALRAALDAQTASAAAAEAAGREASSQAAGLVERLETSEQAAAEVAALAERLRTSEQAAAGVAALAKRLDKLETKGRTAGGDSERLAALERRVEQVAALMAEREARLEQQFEEVRAAVNTSVTKVEGWVGAVEARAEATAGEMAELGDLHAALDVGLGQLRSQLGAMRESQRELSVVQDEFDRRLESVAAIQRAVTAAEEGKGRRGGRRGAEVSTQIAAAQVATEELAKEQKHLRAQLSVIELAADRAAETAAKAWGQVASVGPMRLEVDGLEERLDVQNEALAALTETVQSLLRSGPATPPPAKSAAKPAAATKAPRATKRAAPRK